MPKNQPQLQFLIGNNDYNNNNEQKSKYPNVLEPDGIYHSPVSHVGVRPTTPKIKIKNKITTTIINLSIELTKLCPYASLSLSFIILLYNYYHKS